MIIAKVPLRVSFFGGGTDIPFFYKKNNYGCVLSTTINKYIYITLKDHGKLFNEKFRMNYSVSETSNEISQIKNDILRNIIKYFNIKDNIYISTISDIPSSSGLGSSSSLVVGLFLLLNKKHNLNLSRKEIVKKASEFEIMKISKSIGKQDHYSAFYGGFNYIKFFKNQNVRISKIPDNVLLKKIEKSSLFFWTGIQRSANKILESQVNNKKYTEEIMLEIRKIADEVHRKIKLNKIDFIEFGKYLHKSWILKRKLSNKISNTEIDNLYEKCIQKGAIGGKILGAGGGGFLYILARETDHNKIILEMKKNGLVREEIKFGNKPAEIIYED
jgi:D-glycero-alpha-D-manno-heptose-7-phosphate kinase